MIHNVIFDIGGVMARWDPERWFRQKFGDGLGPRLLAILMGDGRWGDLVDRGVMTEAEYFACQREKYPHFSEHLSAAEESWWDILRPIGETAELIRRLKAAGYRVYYLSNYPERSFRYLRSIMPVFDEMDGGVVSWEVHKIKPEPEIYRLLLERYQLSPEGTVFADDTPANLRAAAELGLSTWRFQDAAGFEAYLKDRLGMEF